MNLQWLTGLIRGGKQFLIQHAPGILMGMGTVGVSTAVVYAAKAGPKAVILLEEAEMEKAKREVPDPNVPRKCLLKPLTFQEKAQVLWKLYIPPVGLTVFGLICFWAAHGIDVRRQALVAGLYSTAEATLNEYQQKVVEMLGEKQNNEIKESISNDHAAQAQAKLPTGYDLGTDRWCYLYGRPFPSTYNKIKEVQNEFNHKLMSEMYMSEAELMWMLDPSGEWLRPGNDNQMKGWTVDKLLILRIPNPTGPVLDVTYEDKYGRSYMPVPGYSSGY